MRATLFDLVRLVLLLLLLPIILILIGPLLILAVLRKRQQVGPITLNTSRYGLAGRMSALTVGLLLWFLVWGGLTWLGMAAISPPATVAQNTSAITAAPTLTQRVTPTPLPPKPAGLTPQLSASPTLNTTPATISPNLESLAQAQASTVTVTVSIPAVTPTSTPQPTPTAIAPATFTPQPTSTAMLEPTATPTFTPTLEPTETSTSRPTATPTPTIPPAVRQAAISAVEAGNELLHGAIIAATEENLQKMADVWQDKALTTARAFAAYMYDRYNKPVNVKFEYLSPPLINRQLPDNRLVVWSSERWTFGSSTNIDHEEAFKFVYTVTQRNGQWVITGYSFLNLPLPTSTPTSSATSAP